MGKERLFVILTRIGFVARGLLYLAIGTLVIFLGRAEGADGALKFLGAGVGRWLLVIIGIGFAGYGLWRLTDAALGTEHPGDGKRAIAFRVGAACSGLVHLYLAYQAAKLAVGAAKATASPDQAAETVMNLPAGQILLIAVAAGIAAAAVVQLIRAARCTFLSDLVPQARHEAIKWLGQVGYLARGAVFLLIAYYVLQAGLEGASWKAGGTEQVFAWLSPPLSTVLAAGLFLFGVFGLAEAWYRRIHVPDIDHLAGRLGDDRQQPVSMTGES